MSGTASEKIMCYMKKFLWPMGSWLQELFYLRRKIGKRTAAEDIFDGNAVIIGQSDEVM